MKQRLGIVLLGLLVSFMSNGFIYEMKVLHLHDPIAKKAISFIGLSDFHDKVHDATKEQLATLDTILQGLDTKKTKIILEDLSSAGSGGRSSCGAFKVNSRGGILGGLATRCRALGFSVDNVEFRYCRVCSLGPVLNNIDQELHDFPSVRSTPLKALTLEVDAILDEIAAYKDGDRAAVVYRECSNIVGDQMKKWKRQQGKHHNVADYLHKQSTQKNRMELIKDLLTFDSVLIDAKMVHSVLNAGDSTRVLAIAGGAHIARVVEVLSAMGYKLIYETDVQYTHERDLKKCVGSPIIDGSYCIRPQPIDLEIVRQYL